MHDWTLADRGSAPPYRLFTSLDRIKHNARAFGDIEVCLEKACSLSG